MICEILIARLAERAATHYFKLTIYKESTHLLVEKITPRFCETDALGHINNTVIAQWFEGAREPLFRVFTPDLDVNKWRLILAKISVEFHAELHYGKSVETRTFISRVGNSSFDVYQEAWQDNKKCASGTAVMVQFNYQTKLATPLSTETLNALKLHLLQAS